MPRQTGEVDGNGTYKASKPQFGVWLRGVLTRSDGFAELPLHGRVATVEKDKSPFALSIRPASCSWTKLASSDTAPMHLPGMKVPGLSAVLVH